MRLKNFVLGFGIFIVYGLVLWQGISAFYPSPEYDEYCDYYDGFRGKPYPIESGVDCVFPNELETKQNACYSEGGEFRYDYDDKGCIIDGYCDECSIAYEDARDVYSRNVFIITLIVGVITFIVGFSILSIEPVGSALLASGVLALVSGTIVNWRNFGQFIRFGLLLLVLILLIWITYRLNKHGRLFRKRKKKK
jgi:hypothetical protein